MTEDDALWVLWDALDRARSERIRVDAEALALVDGRGLVPETYRGGATVEVARAALFKHLQGFCARAD